jgi:hypothetical protein
VNAAPRAAPVPAEIDRWNWGAFLLNWIWGIGNNTWIALLALVPFVGLVWIFVLGAKGSAWAWQNKPWESVEHFRRVQRNWAIAGVVVWLAMIGVMVASFYGISSAIRNSDVYRGALERVNASQSAREALGFPIEAGFPMGSVSVSGPSGEAQLSIPVQGSRASGTLYLQATRSMGRWQYDSIELEVEGRDARIDLNSGRVVPAPSSSGAHVRLAPPLAPRTASRIA